MLYLKALSEEGEWFFEVDEEKTALRQLVAQSNGGYLSSNRDEFLADQEIDYNDLQYLPITQKEFEQVWSTYLNTLHDEWSLIKAALPIGTRVEGFIQCFYPQGIIVNLFKNNALAVIDYEKSREKTPKQWLYPRHLLKSRVKGYDEVNYWVLLEDTVILPTEYAND